MNTHSELQQSLRISRIAEIIKRARLAAQLPQFSDADAAQVASDWSMFLSQIPTDRLEDCYLDAMRERQTKGALGYQELAAAWRKMRADDRAQTYAPPDSTFASGPRCNYCDDTGWQALTVDSPPGRHDAVVKCACDGTSRYSGPHWIRNARGRWERSHLKVVAS
jgi:hypothetical protein